MDLEILSNTSCVYKYLYTTFFLVILCSCCVNTLVLILFLSQASSIFPSVKCGLEMAILNTLAMNEASSFFDVISGYRSSSVEPQLDADGNDGPKQIEICALIDHSGSPKEIADVVFQLVDEGFNTIKLKVLEIDIRICVIIVVIFSKR